VKLFDDFRSFILEEQFSIHIYQNKINVVNYDSIGHFDSNEVRIYYNNGEVIIKGKNLVVSKLMKQEILVVGNIGTMEFRW